MIQKYLDYQTEDRKYYEIEKELKSSPEAKKYYGLKKIMTDATEQIQKLDKESEELMKAFAKNESLLLEIETEIAEMTKALEEVENIDELEYYNKNLGKLLDAFNAFDKEIIKIKSRIQDIKNSYEDLMQKGKSANENSKDAKEKFEALKASKMSEVKEIVEKLKSMRSNLDPCWMESYDLIRKNGKLPAFVPLKGSSCGGCGMDVSVDIAGKLNKPGDMSECPNCHRILYIK